MKKFFVGLQTSGFNAAKSGILQMSCMIDIDNTIVDMFTINCEPFEGDEYLPEVMKSLNLDWDELFEDSSRCMPVYAYNEIMVRVRAYLNGSRGLDKFHFIGYNSYGCEVAFMRSFFIKNGNHNFYDYFWYPPIDLSLIATFILENNRNRLADMGLHTLAHFFGFKVEMDKIFDATYRVTLVRSLYYILEKFKAKVVHLNKLQLN